MTPLLEQALSGAKDYDELPASIRDSYNHKEWLWLSDHEKATLVMRETETEVTEYTGAI